MQRRIYLVSLSATLLLTLAFAVPCAVLVHHSTLASGRTALRIQASRMAVAVYAQSDDAVSTYLATVDDERGTRSVVYRDGRVFGSMPATIDLPPLFGPFGDPNGNPGGPAGAAAGSSAPGGAPLTTSSPPGTGVPGGSAPPSATPDSGSFGSADSTLGTTPTYAVPGGSLAFDVAGSVVDGRIEVRVFVFAPQAVLLRGADSIYLLILGLVAFTVLVAAVLGRYLVRWVSRPLVQTAAAARRLSGGDVDARAPTGGPPEVSEVALALNSLAGRIDALIEEERETLADLSHRLRTPLTALRLDAEALADPAEADRLSAEVTALDRALTAVIQAARHAEQGTAGAESDAAAVVRDRVAFWFPLAEDQGRVLRAEVPQRRVPAVIAAEELGAAVDALIQNVLAHTPEGTGFDVVLRPVAAGGAELVVCDRGPGIPAGALVRGVSSGSSGLGLSIAARSAETAGGALAVAAGPDGGAVVSMRLGPAARSPRIEPDRARVKDLTTI